MLRDAPLRAGVASRKLKSKMNCSLLIAAPPLLSAPIGISQIHVSGGVCQLSPTAVTSLREGCKHLPGRRRRRRCRGEQQEPRTAPAPRPHRAQRTWLIRIKLSIQGHEPAAPRLSASQGVGQIPPPPVSLRNPLPGPAAGWVGLEAVPGGQAGSAEL